MGFFTSQGMEVKLMVCKDSKQNEQEMLGNKKLLQTMQKPSTFQQERLLFFSTFIRFHAAKHKGFLLRSASYLCAKCTGKTYETRLLPSY